MGKLGEKTGNCIINIVLKDGFNYLGDRDTIDEIMIPDSYTREIDKLFSYIIENLLERAAEKFSQNLVSF